MIISRGRKYVFVHIPKTGGTSMTMALEARAMRDDIIIGDTPKAQKRHNRQKSLRAAGRLWKHSRIRDIEGLLSPEEMAEFFVFTLVRNPWDRMVSYYHWLKVQTFTHPAVGLAKSLPFADFLEDRTVRRSLSGDSASGYVSTSAGQDVCDAFIRIEHLAHDLDPLWAHLGFSILLLPVVNASARHSDYRTYYSEAGAASVATLFSEDIQRFGYRFDPAPGP